MSQIFLVNILRLRNKTQLSIQLAEDDYEGWICAKQYYEITYEDYENLNLNDFPKVGDKLSYLEAFLEKYPIPIGSTLPYFHQGPFE